MIILKRGFVLMEFIELLKLQISNHKYQTIPNNRNSKIQTMSRAVRFWSLNIGIYCLEFLWSFICTFHRVNRCSPQKIYNPSESAKQARVMFNSDASSTASEVGRENAKIT